MILNLPIASTTINRFSLKRSVLDTPIAISVATSRKCTVKHGTEVGQFEFSFNTVNHSVAINRGKHVDWSGQRYNPRTKPLGYNLLFLSW